MGEQVFDRVMDRKRAQVLGNPEVPHSVTYIEDFARALVTLGENDDALGEVWHVPCAPAVPIRQFVDLIGQAAGQRSGLRVTPGWVVDSSKFDKAFGWQATPLPDAIEATVAWFSTKR